jgi:hypothetical protein
MTDWDLVGIEAGQTAAGRRAVPTVLRRGARLTVACRPGGALRLYDAAGRRVRGWLPQGQRQDLDFGGLRCGAYFLVGGAGAAVQKIAVD